MRSWRGPSFRRADFVGPYEELSRPGGLQKPLPLCLGGQRRRFAGRFRAGLRFFAAGRLFAAVRAIAIGCVGW